MLSYILTGVLCAAGGAFIGFQTAVDYINRHKD